MSIKVRARMQAAAVASAAAIFVALAAPAIGQTASPEAEAGHTIGKCPPGSPRADSPLNHPVLIRPDAQGSGPYSQIEANALARDNGKIRLATMNAQLIAETEGELVAQLDGGEDPRAKKLAATLQTQRPNVVALTGFDYDEQQDAIKLFQEKYLAHGQDGLQPIQYRYSYAAPVNAGVDSGSDLNHDGTVGGAEDALGHGEFPGQGGMVVLSQLPIQESQVRTFNKLKWAELPNNRLSETAFTALERKFMPLMSRSLWDVPVVSGRNTIHLVVTHLSSPRELGVEQAESARHRDQLQFVQDYLGQGGDANYIEDDAGRAGGLERAANFVLLGQLNSDPLEGSAQHRALHEIGAPGEFISEGASSFFRDRRDQDSTAVTDLRPHRTDGQRLNYVLSKRGASSVLDSGVFWPTENSERAALVPESDASGLSYRLVWADVRFNR